MKQHSSGKTITPDLLALSEISDLLVGDFQIDHASLDRTLDDGGVREYGPRLPKRVRPFRAVDSLGRASGRGLGNVLVEHLNLRKPHGWKLKATPRFPGLELLEKAAQFCIPNSKSDSLHKDFATALVRLNDNGCLKQGWRLLHHILSNPTSSQIELDKTIRTLVEMLPPSLRENPDMSSTRGEQDARHQRQLLGDY